MIPTDDIIAVTQNVLGTMLQYDAVPSGDAVATPSDVLLTGRIAINGEWNGAVLFQMSESLATSAAGRLLMMDTTDVGNEDRVDTLAELTNMIGGNIKSIVPGPSSLSLPTVSRGDEPIAAAKIIGQVQLDCEGDGIRVLVCSD